MKYLLDQDGIHLLLERFRIIRIRVSLLRLIQDFGNIFLNGSNSTGRMLSMVCTIRGQEAPLSVKNYPKKRKPAWMQKTQHSCGLFDRKKG